MPKFSLKELKIIEKWYDIASKYEDLEREEDIEIYDRILADLDGYEEDAEEEAEEYLYENEFEEVEED